MLPPFVDSTHCLSYNLTIKGRNVADRIVSVLGYACPDITYSPSLYPLTALLLHFVPGELKLNSYYKPIITWHIKRYKKWLFLALLIKYRKFLRPKRIYDTKKREIIYIFFFFDKGKSTQNWPKKPQLKENALSEGNLYYTKWVMQFEQVIFFYNWW